MPNKKTYYVDYKHFYNCRPNEEDLKKDNGNIYVKGRFPKTITKGTYILSEYPYVAYDIIREFQVLRQILHKPIVICATSGYWEGNAFLLQAEDDVVITEEDEKIIQDNAYCGGYLL